VILQSTLIVGLCRCLFDSSICFRYSFVLLLIGPRQVDTRAATVSHEKSERGREGEYEFSWQCRFAVGRRGELVEERAFVTSTQCLDRKLTALIHRVFD
jgi:hypothetical protein